MEDGTSVSMFLMTLKNFQDRDFAESIIRTMDKNNNFSPDLYDDFRPLKRVYSIDNINDMVNLWMNDEVNKEFYHEQFASGIFTAQRKKKYKSRYFVKWEKNQYAHFNLFVLSTNVPQVSEEKYFNEFMELCNEFITQVDPVYGYIAIEIENESNPINLRVRIPELKWMNILGEPYIDLFGREQLLSTPCYKVHELSDNIIGVQLAASPHEDISKEVRQAVKRHLGEKAFMEEGKRNINRYKAELVPIFDFSKILFDPQKPIKEPQIHTKSKN